MLVEDLIALLQKGNPKAEVMVFDHLYEHVPLDADSFSFRYHTPGRFEHKDKMDCNILEVTVPDFGPYVD